jgi:type II secretory pathway pseudopilin PulG
MINKAITKFFSFKGEKNENGFSLVEVTIALVILLISVLGVFAVFTYATVYNGGNSRRSQALSVFQQQIELLRAAKFTPSYTDPILIGGVKTPNPITSEADNGTYLIETIVDNDPFTPGIQTGGDPTPTLKGTVTLKEITIIVTPQKTTKAWVLAYPTKVVLRRNRAN